MAAAGGATGGTLKVDGISGMVDFAGATPHYGLFSIDVARARKSA